jgi:hypothetical protein
VNLPPSEPLLIPDLAVFNREIEAEKRDAPHLDGLRLPCSSTLILMNRQNSPCPWGE